MKLIDVAAGLVFCRGQLLITRRLHNDHLGGLWEFPGGKRERGESFEQCLHRELWEELAIEVTIRKFYESVEHSYPGRTISLRFFVCALLRGEPQAIGCSEWKWISREQLNAHEFPPADTSLLGQLGADDSLWLPSR